MKIFTKREALEECIKMWTWLSKHPEAGKFDYFIEMDIKNMPDTMCYCCEYAKDDSSYHNCTLCPVWKDAKNCDEGCYHPDSPYTKWTETKSAVRSKYAMEIVKLAQKALTELKGN